MIFQISRDTKKDGSSESLNMKKNVVLFFSLILLLLIAGAVLVWQKTAKAPAPPVSKIPADWKAYTNTKYHYSLRYPSDYFIFQSGSVGIARNKITEDADAINVTKVSNDPYQLPVFILSATNFQTLSPELIKGQSGATSPNDINLVKTNIADHPAFSVQFRVNGGWETFGIYYVGNSDGQILRINSSSKEYLANQILSSLKFTR